MITSTYGERINPVLNTQEFHNGIDIQGNIGDKVVAVADGIVTEVRESDTYGNVLKYKADGVKNEVEVFYAHLDKVLVDVGDKINVGQVVAKCGNTGLSTGPHLHYSIFVQGKSVDPISFVNLKLTEKSSDVMLSRRK